MITKKGISVRNEVDIFEDVVNDLATEFPTMSKEQNNVLIVLARLLSREIAHNDNDRLEAYNNAYVATATGLHLNKAVRTVGIERRWGTDSYGICVFTRDTSLPILSIPPDTLLDCGDYKFITTNTSFITISDESVEIPVRSYYFGPEYNVPKGSKFKTVINYRGITSIVAKEDFLGGTNKETDQELRDRYYRVINSYSNSSLNGIITEVSKIEDVSRVSGRENNTDFELYGLPPHSFELFVEGSSDKAIAEKIFYTKPAGIQTHGTITEVVDYEGLEYDISFSRFGRQNVYYEFSIKMQAGSSADSAVKEMYSALELFTSSNKKINIANVVGAMYNGVKGIEAIDRITFGLTPNPTTATEIIAPDGMVFFTDSDKIDVTFINR